MPDTSQPFDYEAALEACAQGDAAALRALYERESRWLLGVALRIVRDRAHAEDALQEAFVQIWSKAGGYHRPLGSARGWIYTVVRHRALDAARRLGRELPVGDDITFLSDSAAQAEAARLQASDTREALDHCLTQLDAQPRACIVHAFVDGYTYAQIAATLNTPLGTVKSWIRRSLVTLKACLS